MRFLRSFVALVSVIPFASACSSAPSDPPTVDETTSLVCTGEGIHPAACGGIHPINLCDDTSCQPSQSLYRWTEAVPFLSPHVSVVAWIDGMKAAGCTLPKYGTPRLNANGKPHNTAYTMCPARATLPRCIVNGVDINCLSDLACDACTGAPRAGWNFVTYAAGDEEHPSGCGGGNCNGQ